MRALVTGGGGFLGKSLVCLLLERGWQVRSFSRNAYESLRALGVEQATGDLADASAVERAAEGCDLVFHVAAKAGVWGAYEEYYAANVTGTENVLAACRRHGIRRLVHTSSPSIVFDGTDMEGVDERVPYPRHYEAAYPETKAMAERLVLGANSAELATVALRPHLIWGPEDNHIVPRILARGRAGKLRRIGTRPCLVDSVYIDNAAAAHVQAAERLAPGSAVAGKAYFITNGEPIPLWDLVNKILAADNLPPVTRTIPPAAAYAAGFLIENVFRLLRLPGEPPMTRFVARELSTAHWFDISAARHDFGYHPAVTIEEGIRRLAAWLAGTGAR
ncbi:NAD-dependent epimerase/dehydratase family protein [Geobacter sp. DSM 9736]|uniref:NAD-dependent epimerase/dehydratase family protein n=1 Tax=Geobacter sp. DSM 9736 TaxID=1277350 RepID=UPI000B5030DF|nr:NAD-dependent epimerase/dehydratase family protein [Geobacter sp. DSM 9736]SNB46806.1 Nucleoside-diphosphate-sugar epimerase [Geobacter sp. DSM 9736]